jgi:hypothetical protein
MSQSVDLWRASASTEMNKRFLDLLGSVPSAYER